MKKKKKNIQMNAHERECWKSVREKVGGRQQI